MAKEQNFPHPPNGLIALLAYDSANDRWQVIEVDADGNLQVDVAASALPSGAATAAKQLANDHDVNVSNMISGFATAAKQLADGHNVTVDNATLAVTSGDDKIFAFESIVEEKLSDTNLDAGQNFLAGSLVPSGKVWKITQADIYYVGTVPTSIQINIMGLAEGIYLIDQSSPASWKHYMWSGLVYMQEDDYLRATANGATATDDLYFTYAGVQMDAP